MTALSPLLINRVTDSENELVSLDDAKAQLRICDETSEDALILDLITDARQAIEESSGLSLSSGQAWQAHYECFPLSRMFKILRPPATAITAVKYYDAYNNEQTLSGSTYVTNSLSTGYATLSLTDDFSYPTLSNDFELKVVIEYTAGYTALPGNIRRAILYLVQHFFDNRSMVNVGASVTKVPKTFDYLLNQFRIPRVF